MPAMARAQGEWPSRPLRLIVPFAAGGATDMVGRMLAERLTRRLPQPAIVENRPGVAGTLGMEAAAKSAPDGQSFVLVTSNHAINETLQPKRPYRLLVDLVAVASIDTFPFVLAVTNGLPVRDVASLLAHGRAHSGALNYATSGPGSAYHLAMERLAQAGGFTMQHVPYRNYNEARTALIAGQVDLLFDAVFTLAPLIRAGQVRGLATTGLAPAALLPDLPTVAATVPGFEAALWNGLLAPAGCAPPIIRRMNAEVGAILADAEMQAALAAIGSVGRPMSPAGFHDFLAAEIDRFAQAVQAAGVQPD
jgi:tripartite-type tricarboxylate transporter receptor subunit TctC